MARLLAHEFYHILAQTDDHAPAGIAKARFSTADYWPIVSISKRSRWKDCVRPRQSPVRRVSDDTSAPAANFQRTA